MGKWTRIPQDTFEQIQSDAGVLLDKYDPENPDETTNDDIICPTTGGIQITCQPTYSDQGEDVDNCPNGLLELMHLDSWDCSISTTSLGTKPKTIKYALGAADIDPDDPSRIIPRMKVKVSDAKDIWWIGDRMDGGSVACHLMRGLSSEGFSLQTTKNGKGQIALTITGHPTVATQNVVPMEFYSRGPTLGKLTVKSVAGSAQDGTTVTVTESLDPGNSWKYKLGNSKAEEVTYGMDCKEWTAWDGKKEISAPENDHITVVEVDGDDKAVAVGDCTLNKNPGD